MFGGALARWSVFAASVACTLASARAQTTRNSGVFPRQPWPLQTIEVMAARPNECAAFGPRSLDHVNVSWGQVKALDTRQRCARLAQGLTRVLEQPNEVAAWFVPPANAGVRSQVNAGANEPPRLPAHLWLAERTLLARAWLRSGETSKAFAEFSRLQTQNPLADWHVFALHDFAVSAVRVGRFDVAVACYRRLTSLSQWLPLDVRVNVTLEAAATLLHTSPPRGLEALGLLTELERASVDPNVSFVGAVLSMVARGALEPSQPLGHLPMREGRFELPGFIRLGDEEKHLLHAVARYQESGLWPNEASGSADSSPLATSPTYGAFVSRLRAAR